MKDSFASEKYEKACKLLPGRLCVPSMEISAEKAAEVEEIRLRMGREVHLTMPGGEFPIPHTRVIGEDFEYILDRVTEFSRYTAEQTLRLGYVTAQGGYRIGVCGSMLSDGVKSEGIEEISSLSIRIPREKEDIARPILPKLLENGKLVSTLILSPPGGGKTTLLRDLVRLSSDGTELCSPMRVSLVDERGEIAAMYRGIAQLGVGVHTDVMDGCPKMLAVPMLLRSMTPQMIALDEIALESDVDALCAAANCGVTLLATVHASSVEELAMRPILDRLLNCGVFERAVVIGGVGKKRTYRVEVLA